MKEQFKNAYPALTHECLRMHENGASLTRIWREIFANKHLSPGRCTRMVAALFDLSEEEAQQVERQALDVEKYHTMHREGATNEEVFRAIYTDTERYAFSIQLLNQVIDLGYFLNAHALANAVFEKEPDLRHLSIWEAYDHLNVIPAEITQNPYNQFYTPAQDVMGRWRIISFMLDPGRQYLTLRFCIFDDEQPWNIWEDENLNVLEWDIFAEIEFRSDTLSDFIRLARYHAEQLEDLPQSGPTFSLMTDTEKELYQLVPAPPTAQAIIDKPYFFLQRYYPPLAVPKETILDIRPFPSGKGLRMRTTQISEGENYWGAYGNSLGILHLTQQGIFDLITQLKRVLN